jgi:translocation and assembly module TamA
MRAIFICLLLFTSPAILRAEKIFYLVHFTGLGDKETIEALSLASQLVALRKKRPSSIQALRFRAESDLPALLKILQNYGYLEATLRADLEKLQDHEYLVTVRISPGPRYQIKAQGALPHLEGPFAAQKILDATDQLLKQLAQQAYPFAAIKKQEIIADGQTKTAEIVLEVDKGPKANFGATTIHGLKEVRPQFVTQKMAWEEKEPYDSKKMGAMQKELMDTGLFSSVYITHPQAPKEDGSLPMNVELVESKHKSVSAAANFQMTHGPGVSFSWENRNVGGMGRKLFLSFDLAQHTQSGTAGLKMPDFIAIGQELTLQADAGNEEIAPYQTRSYTATLELSREFGEALQASIGIRPERLAVDKSVSNGAFFLFELPFSLKYSTADSALHATKGQTLQYEGAAALGSYFSHSLTYCHYLPLIKKDFLVIAQKAAIQSIISSNLEAVPVPKRIFGGSEDCLRGYRYYTVSALKGELPIGGRSALFYSLEPRFRLSETIGLVPFFDLGHVGASPLPDLGGPWFKSVGLGLRYFSFLGPFRLDVAFPMDRRKEIDPSWWIFASIGQSF